MRAPVVCIPGHLDEGLLDGCLASVRTLGWPAIYAGGPYALFLAKDETWDGAVDRVTDGVTTIQAHVWADEGAKRTALALAALDTHGPGWILFLDADERIEGRADILEQALPSMTERRCALLQIDYEGDMPRTVYYPRLINMREGVRFAGGLADFDVLHDGERFAWPGMTLSDGADVVPDHVLRIRHVRAQRSAARLERSGLYYQRRAARHGMAMPGGVR